MTIAAKIRRKVIERQGGRCACGCGQDLAAVARAKSMRKYLPRGRALVEIDHVLPRAQGGTDDPENLQALTGWCHHEKTQGERPGWEAPSLSPFAHRILTKPRAEHRPASKAMSLRGKMPQKRYAS